MATKPTDTTYTVITGKAYWASLVTPNTKFEPDGRLTFLSMRRTVRKSKRTG